MTKASLPPAFNRLWIANTAAHGADQLSIAALPLMAALALGASPQEMGVLGAAQTLPYLLLSLLAGLWADRWPRHWLMAGSEAARALLLLSLPVLVYGGWLGLSLLSLLGFLLATASVMFNVASQAYLPALVPRGLLGTANAKLEFARAAAIFLGPGLAGAFAAWASPAIALAVSGLGSIWAAWLLRDPSMRRDLPPEYTGQARQAMLPALGEGLRLVLRQPLLRAIACCAMAWNFSWFLLMAVFVLFASQTLGLGAAEIGLAMGLIGIGMLLASLFMPMLQRSLAFGRLLMIGPILSLLAALAIALSSLPGVIASGNSMVLVGAGFLLFGFGPMLWTISQNSLRQALVPVQLIGRASAIQQVVSLGMRPLGALVGGWVGGRWGLEATIWLGALGFVVQFLMIAFSAMPGLASLPEPEPVPETAD
ncbi:MFS transporter [Ferrovibrio sp.]|uniref:MFS transporter n=1 Tax=Ferrovibrio sp. TaxID=1917215 RepID=UPI0025BB8206|nr:MFS transporter [Ferrovibrio sp.]MBX3454793.1 MFS transporter [Ferrovibrio sp.]